MSRVLGGVLLLAIAACGSAPQPFSIVVPVVVRDRTTGTDIADLKVDQFDVRDRGTAQKITSFELQRRGAVPRFTAYLLDDLHVREIGDFKDMIAATQRQLSRIDPNERVAIYTTSCSVALAQWTSESAAVQTFLDQLKPYSRGPGLCQVPRGTDLHLMLIKAMITRMAAVPGLRNIVVVSPGLFMWQFDGDQTQVQSLIDLAGQSQVLVYGVLLPFPSTNGADLNSEELQSWCEATGGWAVRSGSDLDRAFQKLKLPEAVYIVGVALESVKPDGSVHPIQVDVRDRRKLLVRSRKRFTAPKD
jgi:VWFA-related protein